MRIGIVTGFDGEGYAALSAHTAPTLQAYARRHGYGFHCERGADPGRPASWSKIIWLFRHLSSYDWLLWCDADALVMNGDRDLHHLVDDAFDFVFPGTHDPVVLFCAGVFLIKTSDWAASLLHWVWGMTDFINHVWWEQGALHHLYRHDPEVRRRFKLVPFHELGSLHPSPAEEARREADPLAFALDRANAHLYRPGDFILHLAGGKGRGRVAEYAALSNCRP